MSGNKGRRVPVFPFDRGSFADLSSHDAAVICGGFRTIRVPGWGRHAREKWRQGVEVRASGMRAGGWEIFPDCPPNIQRTRRTAPISRPAAVLTRIHTLQLTVIPLVTNMYMSKGARGQKKEKRGET